MHTCLPSLCLEVELMYFSVVTSAKIMYIWNEIIDSFIIIKDKLKCHVMIQIDFLTIYLEGNGVVLGQKLNIVFLI